MKNQLQLFHLKFEEIDQDKKNEFAIESINREPKSITNQQQGEDELNAKQLHMAQSSGRTSKLGKSIKVTWFLSTCIQNSLTCSVKGQPEPTPE